MNPDIPEIDDPKHDEKHSVRTIWIAHLAWLATRVVFVLFIVAVGVWIKEPLDAFLRRVAIGDTTAARRDEAVKSVEEMKMILDKANVAKTRVFDLIYLAKSLRGTDTSQEGDFNRQRNLAKIACETLNNSFLGKEHTWSRELEAETFQLIEGLRIGIEEANTYVGRAQYNSKAPVRTFDATREYLDQLYVEMESHVSQSRHELRGL